MVEQSKPIVFIVEDDPEDRLLLSFELEGSGLENGVHSFSNVGELIDFHNLQLHSGKGAAASLPALILINAFLQKQDIRQVVIQVKSVEAMRPVPIVLMLGSPGEEEYLRQYRLDVSGFIIKPVTLQRLVQLIGRWHPAPRARKGKPSTP